MTLEPEVIPLPPLPTEPFTIENIPLPPTPVDIKPPPPDNVNPTVYEKKVKEEKKLIFKEKRVTSLGKDTNVAFKKRKITSGARNIRHRDDD
jgi:hypothetical protein